MPRLAIMADQAMFIQAFAGNKVSHVHRSVNNEARWFGDYSGELPVSQAGLVVKEPLIKSWHGILWRQVVRFRVANFHNSRLLLAIRASNRIIFTAICSHRN